MARPRARSPRLVADGDGANDASVVLLVEVDGARLLLTGDIEPPAQAGLGRAVADLRVDVLKVPHHGSRAQDMEFLTSLGARVALVPVGKDNGYGHPAPELLAALTEGGTRVLRTDTSGDLAVVQVDGGLGVATRAWSDAGPPRAASVPTVAAGTVVAVWEAWRTMAQGPRASQVLGRVTLVTGKEEFLNERTVTAVRQAVRQHDADAEMAESLASALTAAGPGGDVCALALLRHPLRRRTQSRGAARRAVRLGAPARPPRRWRTSPWC